MFRVVSVAVGMKKSMAVVMYMGKGAVHRMPAFTSMVMGVKIVIMPLVGIRVMVMGVAVRNIMAMLVMMMVMLVRVIMIMGMLMLSRNMSRSGLFYLPFLSFLYE
jgi:hypothetical protein